MGLFKKEPCVLCGGKTGLLDKKCYDGKVCKECAGKLSVWFDNYKGCDRSLLESQIEIRKTDLEMAERMNFNKIFGDHGVILIDEEEKKFIAFPETNTKFFGSQRTVKSFDDVKDLGPDLISFSMVKDLKIDISETWNEEKHSVNGEQASYSPPRYIYFENFTVKMKIDHPFIKSIAVRLNNSAVSIHNVGRRLDPDAERAPVTGVGGAILGAVFGGAYDTAEIAHGFRCTPDNLHEIEKYEKYLRDAREIERIITGR